MRLQTAVGRVFVVVNTGHGDVQFIMDGNGASLAPDEALRLSTLLELAARVASVEEDSK